MKKCAVYASVIALLSVVCMPAAHAQVSNSPQALSFTLTCGNVTYTVVSPSQATPTALIVGTTNVSIAAVVTENITFTDASGQQQTTQETFPIGPGHGNAVGLQGSETTCTGSPVVFQGLYGPITITTVVTQFTTPRNQ